MPLPDALAPMKAVTGELPVDEGGWAYEVKWDGMRALAWLEGGRLVLRSGRGTDVTAGYPELAGLPGATGGADAVLDGELVVLDADGRPSFARMQHRMHVADARTAAARAAEHPVAYVVFDLLWLDRRDLCARPYLERRDLLTEHVVPGPHWLVPAHQLGRPGGDVGRRLLEAARERRLEGLLAKRVDSAYLPGRRSTAWRKVKVRHRQEVVVGGWLPGEGARSGSLGALAVGVHEPPGGPLRWAGNVGTGFDAAALAHLQARLTELADDRCPFEPRPTGPGARGARWVRPELVGEVEFGEWTPEGRLRHPSWVGLRADKDPADVVREPG